MLFLCSAETCSPSAILAPRFVDASTMIEEKLPRFKVSTRYNHLFPGDAHVIPITKQTDSRQPSNHERDDRVAAIRLPSFPPRSPTSSNSLHSSTSSSSSPLDSTQTVMTSIQTQVAFAPTTCQHCGDSPVSCKVTELNACSPPIDGQAPYENSSVHMLTTPHRVEFVTEKIPPDLIASTLGEENPSPKKRSPVRLTDSLGQFGLVTAAYKDNEGRDAAPDEVGNAGTNLQSSFEAQHIPGMDQDERISRLDAIVGELTEKMLQLRGGSSCVLSNLEQTMRILTQVKASFEAQERCKRDWPKDDGYVGCTDPSSDPEPSSHTSNSAANPDSLEYPGNQYRFSAASQESELIGDRAVPGSTIASRCKSQQWDPDVFSQGETVPHSLTTSQSTYEVSTHGRSEQPYTAFTPPPGAPLMPIPQESGFASSSSSVNKPTRRSALHLAAALFRASSRDRASSAKSATPAGSTTSGPGRYFKRRSKSKDQTRQKANSHTKTVEIPPAAPVLCDR